MEERFCPNVGQLRDRTIQSRKAYRDTNTELIISIGDKVPSLSSLFLVSIVPVPFFSENSTFREHNMSDSSRNILKVVR